MEIFEAILTRRSIRKYSSQAVSDETVEQLLRAAMAAPSAAWRINVEGVRNLLSQTVPRGLRLVHLSCDLVFSGADGRGGYVETDPTDPVTVYGQTMVAGEEAILAADPAPAFCGFRCRWASVSAAMPGPSIGSFRGLRNRGPPRCTSTRLRTPTYTDCLNRLCETMLAGELSGIYHAGGPRRLSLYQIAQIINRVGGYDPDCLMGMPRGQAGPIPPRAGNVCMDCTKLRRVLGRDPFDPWPYCDALVPTHLDWHRQRPDGEPRSPEQLHRVLANNPNRAA